MLGLRGLAIGHRSELSRHRNQESARIAALESLARLRERHAPFGPDYTIVVEHGGEQFLLDEEDAPPVTDPWAERGRAVNIRGPSPIGELLEAEAEDDSSDGELVPEPVSVTGIAAEAREAEAPQPDAATTGDDRTSPAADENRQPPAIDQAGIPWTAFKYAENGGQFQVIREQAGAFSDSVKLWGAT